MKRFWGHVFVVLFQFLLVPNNSASAKINCEGSVPRQPMAKLQEISSQKVIIQKSSGVQQAAEWLRGRQNGETGLLRSYDMPGDCKAWTYDQAAGIIALLDVNDVNTAKRCVDGMLAIWREPNDSNCPSHVWVDGYDSVSRNEEANSIAVGPNAWMGLALLRLYGATGNNKYLSAARDVADFILERQAQDGCAAGSIAGGYDEDCNLLPWTSTEHNADAIAFFWGLAKYTDANAEDYRSAAVKVAEWLDREMWDPNLGCYHPGYGNNNLCIISDFAERLDSQTWTLLALQVMANCDGNDPNVAGLIHNGLPWIDQYSCQVNYEDCNLAGFAKITLGLRATDSFWAEGTGGYVLAARAACHSKTNQNLMLSSLRCLQDPNGSIPYSVGITCPKVNEHFDPCDIILAHFEAHPHCLYGDVGVYGDGEPNWYAIMDASFEEPYSWYYEPEKPGYNDVNVHTGWQSFRLVNATDMCMSQDRSWASLGMDLGPKTCGVVESRDVSDYGKFVFWAKTDNIDGANIEVLFRDANSLDYDPQVSVPPTPSRLGNTWNEHVVDLNGISTKVDLTILAQIGLEFGHETVGNEAGTIIYVDDMGFTDSDSNTALSNGDEMPRVFPQHWPYGSVAATAWFIFAELETNPFAVGCQVPPKPIFVSVGDLNADCWVDLDDLAVLCLQWLQEPGSPPADIAPPDGDGVVSFLDFAVLASQWLQYGD
jgi:hypothetical protein